MPSRTSPRLDQPLTAVMLAGTLRPSPLRRALNRPVLCLPLGNGETVLDAWARTLEGMPNLVETRIVCNRSLDVDAMEAALAAQVDKPTGQPDCSGKRAANHSRQHMRAFAEPASWRGAGGVLRDCTRDLEPDHLVLVIESSALPPAATALESTVRAMLTDSSIVGVVGVNNLHEPAGLFAFRCRAFECVPPVGYFDLKEQLLPALAKQGDRVRTEEVDSQLVRLRDRSDYLAAVGMTVNKSTGQQVDGSTGQQVIASGADVSPSAMLAGAVIIEPDAVVEDGAVVHDSVVLSGACIGGGAVVSESVIGPGATILPRRRVVREIVPSSLEQPIAAHSPRRIRSLRPSRLTGSPDLQPRRRSA